MAPRRRGAAERPREQEAGRPRAQNPPHPPQGLSNLPPFSGVMVREILLVLLTGLFALTATTGIAAEDDPVAPDEENRWDGFLECSVRTVTHGAALCAVAPVGEDDFIHSFDMEEQPKSLVVAMEWETNIALDERLVLLYETWPSAVNEPIERINDASPIEFRIDDPEPNHRPQFRVFAGGEVNVVVQQPFTVHYHLFHEDYAPEGYSALPNE